MLTPSPHMLRHFFSYVPPETPSEEPEVEPPDPNKDRALSDAFRSARRALVALCGISIAWATAQFNIKEIEFESVGTKVDLHNATIPLLLCIATVYFGWRWMIEYGMMPRHVRRWPLAQFDFRFTLRLWRFSLLALAAGALQRSLWSIGTVVLSICAVALAASLLALPLMFVTMPVRMWARRRATVDSAASASMEAYVWAILFAVTLTALGTVAFGVASYRYEPLRTAVWSTGPPAPLPFAIFIATLIAVFLSHWLLVPVTRALFAERPNYRTSRDSKGVLHMKFVVQKREPLL